MMQCQNTSRKKNNDFLFLIKTSKSGCVYVLGLPSGQTRVFVCGVQWNSRWLVANICAVLLSRRSFTIVCGLKRLSILVVKCDIFENIPRRLVQKCVSVVIHENHFGASIGTESKKKSHIPGLHTHKNQKLTLLPLKL